MRVFIIAVKRLPLSCQPCRIYIVEFVSVCVCVEICVVLTVSQYSEMKQTKTNNLNAIWASLWADWNSRLNLTRTNSSHQRRQQSKSWYALWKLFLFFFCLRLIPSMKANVIWWKTRRRLQLFILLVNAMKAKAITEEKKKQNVCEFVCVIRRTVCC